MNYSANKLTIKITFFIWVLSYFGCDGVSGIYLRNGTEYNVQVTLFGFYPWDSGPPGWKQGDYEVEYSLLPGDVIELGEAICEVENDIQFDSIHIKTPEYFFSANSMRKILWLFDKEPQIMPSFCWSDNFKTPYTITILSKRQLESESYSK